MKRGQAFMRPWSQAFCASAQLCGVPSTRITANCCCVLRRNGAIAAGVPAALWFGWYQTFLAEMPAASATGIGKRSAKPRTPLSVPK